VKQLIKFCNHGQEPAKMPPFFWLSNEKVLVQSNKGDSYYVTMAKDCSCPAATYHPGQGCKHQRKYFSKTEPETETQSGIGRELLVDAYAFNTTENEIEYWRQKDKQQTEKLSPGQELARHMQEMEAEAEGVA
jgi:hypothetical protein